MRRFIRYQTLLYILMAFLWASKGAAAPFQGDTLPVKALKIKKFDIGAIGGPHYSSDTKLGLGGSATGQYYTIRDSLTSLSCVTIFADVTTTGYFNLGLRGNNFFKKDCFRIDYEFKFEHFPSDFWGIGFSQGDNKANKQSYKRLTVRTQADFMIEVIPFLFIGARLEQFFIHGKKFDDPLRIVDLDRITRAYGYGISLCLDNRDYIINASKGWFSKLSEVNYIGPGKKPFYKTFFIADYYTTLWKGAILALDYYIETSSKNTPWTLFMPLGGSYRLRGYYEGRYRDRTGTSFQAELRQKIWQRHGLTFWGGAGSIWGVEKFALKNTLPNFGIGYRFELKNRLNVRLDYGFGKNGQSAFLFQVGEAF